ncbi:TPA: hypothetical protein N0F65_002987 [Lagenidium giganteum]|uniref:Glycosyltransferase 61 catalytic domain-containing protein n=1 Tax=Lagenidium giganteum TaxID=4803 RepID=A0AAV2YL16_9STRA|nr:TPA: hypothetical protein N0F65_002987 [Lagenidium giganteum]
MIPERRYDDTTLLFTTKVITIARRDDHNPFFQIAAALNAWIMMQVLHWSPSETRLVQLDTGFPAATDALQHQLLAPTRAVVTGQELVGKNVHFVGPVLLAPSEFSGPMMQHLDDCEPCGDVDLIKSFRYASLKAMNVSEEETTNSTNFRVTIISRRNYNGRVIQRRWLNEDEVVKRMRIDYAQYGIDFVSIDFVQLSMVEQMLTVLQSDVIIGMHGAGMANVVWSRPDTLVVEIFPRLRRRWGFRNLCQFVGCDWHEFRQGSDTGVGDNNSDKRIAYKHWDKFFKPLLMKAYERTGRTAQDSNSQVANTSHVSIAPTS